MYYHIIATRPGDKKKTINNRTEEQVLTEFVIPFVSNGTIKTNWGDHKQTYQVLELRVYKTSKLYDKKVGKSFEDFLGKARNIYSTFEKKAKKSIGEDAHRVFIVMPIQGDQYGTQDQQRIYKEYDERFSVIEKVLGKFQCVAIRIDKEHPLEDVVGTIKREIRKSKFIIADLTDERPACYFEAGYSEALGKPVIYIASKESVGDPKKKTIIHFDIHMHVNYFSNQKELGEKLKACIKKNSHSLLTKDEEIKWPVLTKLWLGNTTDKKSNAN